MGVGFQRVHILLNRLDAALQLFNLLREVPQQTILQPVLLALVVGLHDLQPGNLHIQIHALLNSGITGAQGFDFRKGQRHLIHIIAGAHRGFGSHDLGNELLLILHGLPQEGVEGAFRHITEHMDFLILVALTLDSAFALLQITGPPG